MPFSPFSKEEFLECLPERLRPDISWFKSRGITEVELSYKHNFTVVILKSKNTDYLGISKRNPSCDNPNDDVRLSTACSRAFKDAMGSDEGYGRHRETSKKEAHKASANAAVDKAIGYLS